MLGKITTAAAVATLSITVLCADDFYRNDFSTRTSGKSLPGDRWMSYTYDPSNTLCYNYPYDSMAESMSPSVLWNSTAYQDSWAKVWIDSTYMRECPGFAVETDSVHGSSDNAFALFRSSTSRSGTVIQPLHNEFTNGILRVEVDIRRPSVWGGTAEATYAARFSLVYRKYMNPVWGIGVNRTEFPTMFGAYWDGAGKNSLHMFNFRNGNGNEQTLTPGSADGFTCEDNWYRWRVYVDLDNGRCTYYIWNAGDKQPDGRNAMDDTTATRAAKLPDYNLRDPITGETGGVAGIGLTVYRTRSGTGDALAVTNAPCFDNIHIAWKAPDSTEYVPFYENDFNTRRYRRICPASATEAEYPVNDGALAADTFRSYAVSDRDQGHDQYSYLVNTATGLLGMDNWIRLDKGNKISVVDSGTDGGAVLCATPSTAGGTGGKGVVVQTLGEEIVSGKVRASADVRLPLEWAGVSDGSARVCLALGNEAYWSGNPDQYVTRHVGYGGITGSAVGDFHPAYLPKSGNLASTMDDSVECSATNWYRVVVTADLVAKTYDYTLYHIGPLAGPLDRDDVPETAVYSKTGIPFRNTLSGIASFSLFANQPGSDWDNYILWDNIRVWKNWDDDTGSGTLIYENDFDVRTRYVTREKTPLVGGMNTGVGVDAWKRVNKGEDDSEAMIAGEGNRFLALKAEKSQSLYLTHDFPGKVPGIASSVKFRVDVRPPCWWLDAGNGQSLDFYLGGDEMGQFADPSSLPLNDSVIMFGLTGQTGAASLGRFTNTVFRVRNGGDVNGITSFTPDSSHWYRLEVTMRSGSDTWSFRVYDMGADHPGIDAANGAVVAGVGGLACRADGTAGGDFTSVAIRAGGISGLEPWDLYDRGKVLLDNMVIETVPAGTCIIVR